MYQPLITFCPHPAIFTQVLCIFVYLYIYSIFADNYRILIDEPCGFSCTNEIIKKYNICL